MASEVSGIERISRALVLVLPALGLVGQYLVLGFPPVLPTYGFGVALGLGILVMTVLLLRWPAWYLLNGFSFFLLPWVILSAQSLPIASFQITVGWQAILFGIVSLVLWGTALLLNGYPLRRGLLALDPQCQRLYHIYNRGLVYSGGAFLVLNLEMGTSYAEAYDPLHIFLVLQGFTWALLLLLSAQVEDEAVRQYVAKQGLQPHPLRRPLWLGWGLVLLLGTLCEMARGAWGLWAGTAIVLSLALANFWKVWKHLLDVPRAS